MEEKRKSDVNDQSVEESVSIEADEVETAEEQNKESQEELSSQEIDKILATIDEKNRLYEQLNDKFLRLQADFNNFRRRARQEKEELGTVVKQDIVLSLLPVLDNFDRAISSANPQDAESILLGLKMIHKQLSMSFEKLGVTSLEVEGNVFDPNFHEAVMRVEDETLADGTIIEELQKGYMVSGKVIRPSMVKVVNNS